MFKSGGQEVGDIPNPVRGWSPVFRREGGLREDLLEGHQAPLGRHWECSWPNIEAECVKTGPGQDALVSYGRSGRVFPLFVDVRSNRISCRTLTEQLLNI